MSKVCIQCNQELPLDQFPFRRSRKRPRDERRNSRCRSCASINHKEWQKIHGKERYQYLIEKYGRQYFTDAGRKNLQRLRIKAVKVLNPNLKPQCKICGFVDESPAYSLLQIDHINNNGADERKKQNSKTPSVTYRKIIKMNPEDALREYQTLCIVHNWLKRLGVEGLEYKIIKTN